MFRTTTWLRRRGRDDAPDSTARFVRSSVFFDWCRDVTSTVQKATLDFIHSVDAWIAALARAGRSPNTLDCYRRDGREFRGAGARVPRHGAIFDMAQVCQEEINLVASAWEKEGASGQTISRRFSAVKGFAAHLCLAANVNGSRILAAKFPAAASGRVLP